MQNNSERTYSLFTFIDQNKSGFFEGPAFFQPIRAFQYFLNCSEWLDKSRLSKKALKFIANLR